MKRVDRAMASTLRLLVRAYQLLVAPILPMSCRYYPSCSRYAAEALARHGGCAGTVLAVGRLLRCHPWGGHGIDPVPQRRADDRRATGRRATG
jgi:putative membrane protein insertion efficiency factor